MPGTHAIVVMLVAAAAFYLYTRSWIRMELVSLLLLLALLLIFFAFPYRAGGTIFDDTTVLTVFGHPVIVAICCLMILGRALLLTGALEPAIRVLVRVWNFSRTLGLLLTLLVAAGLSAFINDTPVLVLLLPMLLAVAERTGASPAPTLMPVNFAVLTGGMLTALGTSTNLLVLSIAEDLGMKPIGIFGFTQIAASALAVAGVYLWLVAPWLLRRSGQGAGETSSVARRYEARAALPAGSAFVGLTPAQLERRLGRPLEIRAVIRAAVDRELPPGAAFEAGDELIVADTPAGLRELAKSFGVELYDRNREGRFVPDDDPGAGQKIAEVIVGAGSPLNGRSLSDTRFAEQFGLAVVAVRRGDEGLLRRPGDLAHLPLLPGDLLLLQGPATKLEAMHGQWDLTVIDASLTIAPARPAIWAVAIMAATIGLAAFKVFPIHIAAFIGVVAVLLRGCIRFEQVGRALSLEVILLVASSIALGQSLVHSGAAAWLGSGFAAAVQPLVPAAQVAAVMGFSALLTNFVSNSAAAAIGTPIAMAIATQLGLPPEPFVLAILFGANLSYATPMAYQTNLIVMNAARYTFQDFVRVGMPLVLLMLATLSWLLARHYGL